MNASLGAYLNPLGGQGISRHIALISMQAIAALIMNHFPHHLWEQVMRIPYLATSFFQDSWLMRWPECLISYLKFLISQYLLSPLLFTSLGTVAWELLLGWLTALWGEGGRRWSWWNLCSQMWCAELGMRGLESSLWQCHFLPAWPQKFTSPDSSFSHERFVWMLLGVGFFPFLFLFFKFAPSFLSFTSLPPYLPPSCLSSFLSCLLLSFLPPLLPFLSSFLLPSLHLFLFCPPSISLFPSPSSFPSFPDFLSLISSFLPLSFSFLLPPSLHLCLCFISRIVSSIIFCGVPLCKPVMNGTALLECLERQTPPHPLSLK